MMETANLATAFEGSYYTILGAGGDLSDWTKGIAEFLDERGIGIPQKFFTTTGKDINAFAEARGEVAPDDHFPADLTVLMFPLDGLDGGKLAIFRLLAGDRWFDDVVNNMVAAADDADEDEL